jgi:ABC-type molybdate transport system ATPase subunit
VIHLGFEVRVELRLAGGERVWAQVTRDQAEQLELEPGDVVFVCPSRTPAFAA